jgi:hypothetical protein
MKVHTLWRMRRLWKPGKGLKMCATSLSVALLGKPSTYSVEQASGVRAIGSILIVLPIPMLMVPMPVPPRPVCSIIGCCIICICWCCMLLPFRLLLLLLLWLLMLLLLPLLVPVLLLLCRGGWAELLGCDAPGSSLDRLREFDLANSTSVSGLDREGGKGRQSAAR